MENYTKIQKFLHDLVLKKSLINKSLFEIEKIFYLKKNKINKEAHVFITGMPRSGTTSLLNFLYSSEQYASLTYKNIPFVLSPNFSKLFNSKNILPIKRIHGDEIDYDLNSPESFDEIFFNNDDKFVKNELINYLYLICLSKNKKKYLSKNNLNFSRINLITEFFPNCQFLIPIREPLQHSYSLFKQHLHFIKIQKEDNFILRYMNYLGHFEFGLNHKPWNKPIIFDNPNDINYWLEQWYLFYENIFNRYQYYKNCHFIVYEELTNSNYVKTIIEKLNSDGFQNINLKYFKNSNKLNLDIEYSKDIYEKTKILYENFKN